MLFDICLDLLDSLNDDVFKYPVLLVQIHVAFVLQFVKQEFVILADNQQTFIFESLLNALGQSILDLLSAHRTTSVRPW